MTTNGSTDSRRARQLWIDRVVHADEVARFLDKVVAGPSPVDCSIWVGAIGKDGYGRFFLTRAGRGICVRPHRYALALATGGQLDEAVFGLHECDNPICVKVSAADAAQQHVVAGTQHDNMRRMVRARRGGGRPGIPGLPRAARRARSVALRAAVAQGVWNDAAVRHALLGDAPRLF